MDIEENLISSFARKRLCIKTKQANNILEKFKVIFKGNVYMAHAKELFAWTPNFLDYKESEYISDNESLHGAKNKGNVSDEILLERMELTRQLHDINQMEARDYVQKSKIKWAIEGDENSKFFHGIINKKCSQLSISGVFVDGYWNTDPEVVKDVFKDHFCNSFQTICPCVSRDEIWVAVWNCDENKSPGPSGGSFSKGSNSSLIALIPKVTDAKFVTDFRPTSLIRCVYKVVTKILANSLARATSDGLFKGIQIQGSM
nr:RNA-directed DNA polymerase, eukaryota [Tanacetum cinerariifolium]